MITNLNVEHTRTQLSTNSEHQDTPTQAAKTLIYQFRNAHTGRVNTLEITKELS